MENERNRLAQHFDNKSLKSDSDAFESKSLELDLGSKPLAGAANELRRSQSEQ